MPVPVGRLACCEQRQEQAAVVKPLFSERRDGEQSIVLHEGVPDFLFPSLLDWTVGHYSRSLSGKRTANRQMVLSLERRTRRKLPPAAATDPRELGRSFWEDDDLFLDAIDLVLSQTRHYSFDERNAEELESILEEAGSAYCVGTDEDDNFELQFRQSEEMTDLLEAEASQPGNAGAYLRKAWSKCFGLNPDTKGACIEAVSAVEVAAKPIISPDNSRTTLGTLCRDMEAKPSKWETDSEYVASVEAVLNMMKLVWNEGHYRHGDDRLPLEVSQESAEMTVQTAVLLVSWFRSERIRLKQ